MDIHHAIRCDDWEQFSSLLDKVNPLDQDELNGDTILHCLAEKIDEVNPVKKFFAKKKTLLDYILMMNPRLMSFNSSIGRLALVQNNDMDTALHKALYRGNWALAYRLRSYVNYCIESEWRRNKLGLTEYELAIILYGLSSHRQITDIFALNPHLGTPYLNSLYVAMYLPQLKRIVKSMKVIRDQNKNLLLARNDELFAAAVEEEYPSIYATLPDNRRITRDEREDIYRQRIVWDRN